MCGICGIYNFRTKEPVNLDLLKAMNDTLVHRGPDEEGFYVSGPVGLGHRRLSIIDLEGGKQPMTNEDQTIWVVFNGEIYNFPELHDYLVKKGHIFETRSDTEVIIHMYEEVGERCFESFRGMFAIALWDNKKKKLVLARDRFGKKPLYYCVFDQTFVFGSELKAILKHPSVKKELDMEALNYYLTYEYVPTPKTIFKNIQSLAAKVFISRYQSSERKCYPPLELAKKMKLKKPAEIYLDAKTAFNQARKQAGKNDLILVTGSFYLAGELRQHWRNEESLLEERKI